MRTLFRCDIYKINIAELRSRSNEVSPISLNRLQRSQREVKFGQHYTEVM